MERLEPLGVEVGSSEERLEEHQHEDADRHTDDRPTYPTDDGSDQHQDGDEMQHDEAALSMWFQALAAEDPEAGEEEPDRHGQYELPGKNQEHFSGQQFAVLTIAARGGWQSSASISTRVLPGMN